MPDKNTSNLKELFGRNLPLHTIMELEIKSMPYGQMIFNVMIKDGVARIETLEITKTKRIRY
mgnify:CR=1 FL=1